MHFTNLDYLNDGSLHFTELPDGGMKESNKMLIGLNIVTIIPETDNQDPPNLIDSEIERANKKKKDAKKRRQKKINLA